MLTTIRLAKFSNAKPRPFRLTSPTCDGCDFFVWFLSFFLNLFQFENVVVVVVDAVEVGIRDGTRTTEIAVWAVLFVANIRRDLRRLAKPAGPERPSRKGGENGGSAERGSRRTSRPIDDPLNTLHLFRLVSFLFGHIISFSFI